MNSTLRSLFLIVPLFLLSSCIGMDVSVRVNPDGKIHEDLTVDISKFAKLMEGFSGSSTENINKNLCGNKSFVDDILRDEKKLQNVSCTSLGDYRSKISGDMITADMPQILTLSGVTIFDAGFSQKKSASGIQENKTSNDPSTDPKSFGVSITGKVTLPGKIVYAEGGTLISQDTVSFDFLDPKFQKRIGLYVVSTDDGRTLTQKELNRYKLLLRKKIRESKKQ